MLGNNAGGAISHESKAEPIKIGYLMDFLLSDDFPQHYRDDLTIPFDMVLGTPSRKASLIGQSRLSTARWKASRREP
jgi:hypothetical protein